MSAEGFETLIARSSFGTVGARRLRARTSLSLVASIVQSLGAGGGSTDHTEPRVRDALINEHRRVESDFRNDRRRPPMPKTVQDAFEQFEHDVVRVPKVLNDEAKDTQRQIRSWLEQELDSLKETFLSGSYSRRVQVVRLKDIDIIVVLDDDDDQYSDSALTALEEIRDTALSSPMVSSAQARVRSVRLELYDHEFTIDLVAALEPTNGIGHLLARHIPEEGLDDWTPANPHGQREAARAKNKETAGMYVPAVRLVKYWLGTVWGIDHKPFRSYHAESILYGALSEAVDFDEAMVRFFDAAYDALAPGVLTPDPGDPAHFVDDRLEDRDRRESRDAVMRAQVCAHAAFETQDVDEALDKWDDVFGSAFPAPRTSTEQVAAALGAREAGVVGAGVRVNEGRSVIQSRSWRER